MNDNNMNNETGENPPHQTGIKCEGWSGPCNSLNATRRHMDTQYAEKARNYATLCPECWKECDAYWADMWADLYSGYM